MGLAPRDRESFERGDLVSATEVDLTAVGGLQHKLPAAHEAGIRDVAIHKDNAQVAAVYRDSCESRCRIRQVSNFLELYNYLTIGSQIDGAVNPFVKKAIEEWDAARKGDFLGGDDHHLEIFVEPRISILKESKSAEPNEEQWEELAPGVSELLQRCLFDNQKWLLITEEAGGVGKPFSPGCCAMS